MGSRQITDEEWEFVKQKDFSQEAEYFERKEAEDDSVVGDVLQGIGHGAVDAVDETLQFAGSAADLAVETVGDVIGTVGKITGMKSLEQANKWDWYDPEDNDRFLPEIFDKPSTTAGKFAEDITQFGVGLVGAGKFRMAARATAVSKGGMAARTTAKVFDHRTGTFAKKLGVGAVDSAVASLVVQDPYEETLAEIVSENDMIGYEVADFLANKEDDDIWTRRLKNVGEDMLLSGAIFGLAKVVKRARGSKETPVGNKGSRPDLSKEEANEMFRVQRLNEAHTTLRNHVKSLRDSGRVEANADALKATAHIESRSKKIPLIDYLKGMAEGTAEQEFKTLIHGLRLGNTRFNKRYLDLKAANQSTKKSQRAWDGFYKDLVKVLDTPAQRKTLGLDGVEDSVLIIEKRIAEAYDARIGIKARQKVIDDAATTKQKQTATNNVDDTVARTGGKERRVLGPKGKEWTDKEIMENLHNIPPDVLKRILPKLPKEIQKAMTQCV